MKYSHNLLLLLIIAAVAGCPGTKDSPPGSSGDSLDPDSPSAQYFPPGSLDDRPDLHSILADWYSGQLKALEELSLYAMRKERAAEAYRFLWLRTFHHPVAVRIVLKDDGGTIVSKMCDGAGGYKPGKLIVNRSAPLSPQQKTELNAMLESTGFWTLPSNDRDSMGLDGSQWIVEAVTDGKYHIVDRWSPKSGPVRDLGLFFIKIGDFDREEVY